jgi:glycosyltransferase involved in cell wall biosynthesis
MLVVHDLIALEHPEFCSLGNRLQMQWLLARSARHASLCLCPSDYVANKLRQLLDIPASRLAVAPWGVDYQVFATSLPPPKLATLPPGQPYFLFVGNLEPKKNLTALLQAYSTVADSTGAALVLAGRYGWRCAALARSLRHWSGPGKVIWLGRVSQPQLIALYQHALALVLPSWTEGFGLPVLEAMAAGTPVLHSDHPALRETAGGAGRDFPPDAPDRLADLMRQLAASSTLREEMRVQGRERAKLCPWGKWGQQAAQLVQNL